MIIQNLIQERHGAEHSGSYDLVTGMNLTFNETIYIIGTKIIRPTDELFTMTPRIYEVVEITESFGERFTITHIVWYYNWYSCNENKYN